MDTDTALIIAAIIISVVTTIVGSDVLIAEFFTDFHVESIGTSPGWVEHRTYNNGTIQANNAILTIYANAVISEFKSVCPEGNIDRINDQILVVKFQRMSPYMVCSLSMNVLEPTDFGFIITSDNRGVWILNHSVESPITQLSYMIVIYVLEGVLIITLLPKWRIWRSQFRKFSIDFSESQTLDWRNAVRQFVFREYGVKIDMDDAVILGLIHMKKTTKNQLKTYASISGRHIRHRIWKMRRLDLLSKKSMVLDTALTIFFETEFQYSGDHSRSLHDMYKYSGSHRK